VYLYLPLNGGPHVVPSPQPAGFSPPPGCQTNRLEQLITFLRHDVPSADGGDRAPRNYSWAELMHRMFSVDVLECVACGSRIRIVSAIHPPEAIRKSLVCVGIPSRAPPIAPASRIPE
jgi:hypothetical protein